MIKIIVMTMLGLETRFFVDLLPCLLCLFLGLRMARWQGPAWRVPPPHSERDSDSHSLQGDERQNEPRERLFVEDRTSRRYPLGRGDSIETPSVVLSIAYCCGGVLVCVDRCSWCSYVGMRRLEEVAIGMCMSVRRRSCRSVSDYS
ncbi:hypothetical protein B0T10DRAFT_99931 [Thelonectria olida]|uniref:Uncharacterized protein n=1 Tax=Thelonectria olida TaxID=1576542 RepID=A0A9P8WFY3_9HYPO|nr:hypothetical protein B0T10DRAFT_99931 [Thelonectria olida]